jgi:multicomponent Na+:H+ antiporter subunit B
MTPLIRLVSVAVLPAALLISLSHLVGAEHGPGDGFTAGIISALGVTLEYELRGYRAVRDRLGRLRFEHVLGTGLAVTLVAATLPLLLGGALLGELAAAIPLPVVAPIELTQAHLLDLGIYLAVAGGALTAIDHLRSSRP